jgi:hypothetical protein
MNKSIVLCADVSKIVKVLACDIDINSMDEDTECATLSYIAGLLRDYTFVCFLHDLGYKATAFCIQNNLGLPRFKPAAFPQLEPIVLDMDSHSYALVALRLIDKNASPDCNVHVRDKLIHCIQRWVAEHTYEVPPGGRDPQ